MARHPVRTLEGYVRHFAFVDTDRRQVSYRLHALGKPQLACDLLRYSRGLTTSLMNAGDRGVQFDFDLVEHELIGSVTDGAKRSFKLEPMTVAKFYKRFLALTRDLGVQIEIHDRPNEVADPIPFAQDATHASYDADAVNRYWRALVQIDRVLKYFRTGFLGKVNPVHLFWGSFDLAVTRFSGRVAPIHPGGIPNLPDEITREAYSHEVSSAGFWPGGGPVNYPAFYSYAYPRHQVFPISQLCQRKPFSMRRQGNSCFPTVSLEMRPIPIKPS